MPFGGLLIAGGASIAGSLLGNAAAERGARNARDLASQAMGELRAIGLPPDQSARIVLQKLQQQGLLTPELEQDINIQASIMQTVTPDQEAIDTQKRALRQIEQRAQVGLTPIERVQLAQIQQQAAQTAKSARQQNLMAMQERGITGGGAELAAALSASQGAAQTQSAGGLQIGAEASKNALAALGNMGTLAGNIRTSSFDEASKRAEAEDLIKKFNVTNAINRQQRNVEAKRRAEELNLGEKQRIADKNISMENEESYKQLERQRNFWRDRLEQAKGFSESLMGQSRSAADEGNRKAKMWGELGQSAGTMAMGISRYPGSSAASAASTTSATTSTPQYSYDPYRPVKLIP